MSEKTTPTSPEEALRKYAQAHEGAADAPVRETVANESPANRVGKSASQQFKEEVQEEVAQRLSLKDAQIERRAEILEEQKRRHLGYINLPVEDLPTGGIFYPEGMKISLRAASGAEIRHWSMINEQSLSEIDDALNYIIERCVTISLPQGAGSWKDLKEIDRLYILLSVRDFTFTDGHNELKVAINETEDVVVKRDNIEFINLPDGILKYYNSTKRCFTFPSDTPGVGEINFYMPSLGVNQWLKQYVIRKQQQQENIDVDFVNVAPMLIEDYRNLNDKTYQALVAKSNSFSIMDWSLITKVRKTITESIDPQIVYVTESGVEEKAPLNFRGGIKALFIIQMDELGF